MHKLFALTTALFCLTGCFEMNHELVLEKNLSGTYAMAVVLDLEPVAYAMALVGRSLSGKDGTLTEEEFATYKTEFEASRAESGSADGELSEEDLKAALSKAGPGIEVKEATATYADLKMDARVRLAFDDLQRLAAIEMEKGEGTTQILQRVEVGKGKKGATRLAIWLPAMEGNEQSLEPSLLETEGEATDPLAKRIAEKMSRAGVRWTVTVPGKPVHHDATEANGSVLTWWWPLDKISEMGGKDPDLTAEWK